MRLRAALLVLHQRTVIFPLALVLLAAPGRAEVPADGWVVFASNREDGRHEIYRMKADGSEVTRLTFLGGKVPAFSTDGAWVLYHLPAEGSIHVMRPDGSGDRKVCDGSTVSDGVPAFWLRNKNQLVCAAPQGEDVEYYLADPLTDELVLLFRKYDFTHLQTTRFEPGGITPDGRWLVGWAFGLYNGGYTGDNGTFDAPHSTVVLDIQDQERIYYFGPGCLSSIAPEGGLVYHITRDSPTVPDIARMHIDDLMTRSSYQIELALSDAEWGHMYMPAVSNDSLWLAYAASQGCHDWYTCDYDIFLHQLGAGTTERTRLTQHSANDNFPSIFIGELPEPLEDAGVDAGIENDDPASCGCSSRGVCGGFWLLLILPVFWARRS
jgi:Tol biopolymer transport system component